MIQAEPHQQPADEPSSERLLHGCALGDREAFRALYGRFSSSAYGLALRVLRDEQLAQDAVQEAFTQVWTDAATFDDSLASARSWVMTLVHRRAVDRVRREEADRSRGRAWGTRQVVPAHDSVAEIVELRAEHRRVRTALATLTKLQRQALELAYYGGLTQTQIAERLGIPLGTAKTRLRDALRRLREVLEATS